MLAATPAPSPTGSRRCAAPGTAPVELAVAAVLQCLPASKSRRKGGVKFLKGSAHPLQSFRTHQPASPSVSLCYLPNDPTIPTVVVIIIACHLELATRTSIRSKRLTHLSSWSACSQTLITWYPRFRSARLVARSRRLFPRILALQNSTRVLGILPHLGQACQKQPSKKTTKRGSGK